MVSPSRVTTDGALAASRDSTLASVWQNLNRQALRIGLAATSAASIAYPGMFLVMGTPAFLQSSLAALGAVFVAVYGLRQERADAEAMLVAGALAAIAASGFTSPVLRDGM